MSKREKFSFELQCTKCRKTGSVTYEENSNPVYTNNLEREIILISEGFEKGNKKDSMGDFEIICSNCKNIIKH